MILMRLEDKEAVLYLFEKDQRYVQSEYILDVLWIHYNQLNSVAIIMDYYFLNIFFNN